MSLQVYNTLSRSKEEFIPLHPGRVGMYVCGMTVYSDAHIGHAKSYVSFDVVRRYLMFLGYKVTYIQNITDVGHMTDNDEDAGEDKLLKKSQETKIHPMQIAETFTRRTTEDLAAMNILPADIAPRASGHIIEQIEIIVDLISKGYAYEVNGSVYFEVAKDSEYGKLSGRNVEDQETSGRIESRSEKRNPQDFALWKRAEKGHILRWASPWGDGFPGWHIECSAMSMKYLGQTIDIHGGGLENQFPHHECEIAQSECSTGKQFVRYWMHHNMVTVDGTKMGKSLGNSSYLRDLFAEFDPMTLRFFLLQSHYRSTTEFKKDAIEGAGVGYNRLLQFINELETRVRNNDEVVKNNALDALLNYDEIGREPALVQALLGKFKEIMDDDFNTSKAIALLFEIVAEARLKAVLFQEQYAYLRAMKVIAGQVLGILPASTSGAQTFDKEKNALAALVETEILRRKEARARKDFAQSDIIRDDLAKAGIVLEDSKEGTNWSLK